MFSLDCRYRNIYAVAYLGAHKLLERVCLGGAGVLHSAYGFSCYLERTRFFVGAYVDSRVVANNRTVSAAAQV